MRQVHERGNKKVKWNQEEKEEKLTFIEQLLCHTLMWQALYISHIFILLTSHEVSVYFVDEQATLRKIKQIGQMANWNSTLISLPLTLCHPTLWTLWSVSNTIFYQHKNIQLTYKITRQMIGMMKKSSLWIESFTPQPVALALHIHIQGLAGHSRVISPLLTCSLFSYSVPPMAVPVPKPIHQVFKGCRGFSLQQVFIEFFIGQSPGRKESSSQMVQMKRF